MDRRRSRRPTSDDGAALALIALVSCAAHERPMNAVPVASGATRDALVTRMRDDMIKRYTAVSPLEAFGTGGHCPHGAPAPVERSRCPPSLTRDAHGCLASEHLACRPPAEETKFTCDATGKVVRVDDFEVTGELADSYAVEYDDHGRRTRFVAPDGRTLKRFTYDSRGRIVDDGAGIHLEYDEQAMTVTVRFVSLPSSLTYDYSCRLAVPGP